MYRRLLAVAVILLSGWSLSPVALATSRQETLYDGRNGQSLSVRTAAISSSDAGRIKSSWSWYVARASGILAAVLLALLIVSGIGLLTGQTYKFLEPLPAWAAHRAIGLSFGVLVLVHVFVLLFDKFVGFDIADLLVPFASNYKPATIGGLHLGSLYMALGILSLYAIVIVTLSSLYWMNTKPKPWRLLHYLSYFIVAATFFHALFLGTDLKHGLVRFLWFAGAAGLLIPAGLRLYRARTIGKGL